MKHILPIALVSCALNVHAQTGPGMEWQERYGGSGAEEARGLDRTLDGGYVLVGTTGSSNGMITGHHGGTDMWVV